MAAVESYWDLYCRNEHDLLKTTTGWKIIRLKMKPIYQQSNANLVVQAYQEAAGAAG